MFRFCLISGRPTIESEHFHDTISRYAYTVFLEYFRATFPSFSQQQCLLPTVASIECLLKTAIYHDKLKITNAAVYYSIMDIYLAIHYIITLNKLNWVVQRFRYKSSPFFLEPVLSFSYPHARLLGLSISRGPRPPPLNWPLRLSNGRYCIEQEITGSCQVKDLFVILRLEILAGRSKVR